jgi:hypothetical protein
MPLGKGRYRPDVSKRWRVWIDGAPRTVPFSSREDAEDWAKGYQEGRREVVGKEADLHSVEVKQG